MFSKSLLIFLVLYFLSGFTHAQSSEKDDYSYIEASNSSYKIHTTYKTWTEGKQVCAMEGATLWYPENDDEVTAVESFWNTTQPGLVGIYVGLTYIVTEGMFKTIDGRSISEVYHKWHPTQPDVTDGSQPCLYFYKGLGLADWGCDNTSPFICKKSGLSPGSSHDIISDSDGKKVDKCFRNDYSYIEAEESFYKIHISPQTWADAKRVCSLEGATFWHPDNDDEARTVISFWNTTQPHIGWVYVGLADVMAKGVFETVDGRSVSEVYNKWQPGQPNYYEGKQDCVYIYKEGLLDDWGCDDKYSFICKKTLQSLEWNSLCNISDSDYTFNEDIGKCYKLHTTPLNWTDSYTVCRLEQSYLAVINNRLEANYLGNLTQSTRNPRVKQNYQRGIYHVGFHNKFNEGWQTVKGTPMNVDLDIWWDHYDPADDRDQCGSMFYTGRLINTNCDMKSFFICEHEPTNSCT